MLLRTTEHLTELNRHYQCIPGRHRTMHRHVAGSLYSQQTGAEPSSPGRPPDGPHVYDPAAPPSREPERRPEDPHPTDRTGCVRRSRASVGTLPATPPRHPTVQTFRNWFAGIRCPAFDQQRRSSFREVAGRDGRGATGKSSRLQPPFPCSRRQPGKVAGVATTPAWHAPLRAIPGLTAS
jgi:hypothetical protein